jgi:hypothetical protein
MGVRFSFSQNTDFKGAIFGPKKEYAKDTGWQV